MESVIKNRRLCCKISLWINRYLPSYKNRSNTKDWVFSKWKCSICIFCSKRYKRKWETNNWLQRNFWGFLDECEWRHKIYKKICIEIKNSMENLPLRFFITKTYNIRVHRILQTKKNLRITKRYWKIGNWRKDKVIVGWVEQSFLSI